MAAIGMNLTHSFLFSYVQTVSVVTRKWVYLVQHESNPVKR